MTKYLFLLFLSATALAQPTAHKYSDGAQNLTGFYAPPKDKTDVNAGVLILPAWMGTDSHSKESAEKLSALGIHAFVADIYGDGNNPKNTTEAGQRSGFFKKNHKDYVHRINLALQQLIKLGANPKKIAIIGYCLGGTGALEAARAGLPVQGVVAFHGGLGRDASRIISPITTKILVCHGADDPMVPKTEISAFEQEMRDAKADWQMVYYADAVHGFTEPSAGSDKSRGVAYNEKAARRSWEHMLLFFSELFRQ